MKLNLRFISSIFHIIIFCTFCFGFYAFLHIINMYSVDFCTFEFSIKLETLISSLWYFFLLFLFINYIPPLVEKKIKKILRKHLFLFPQLFGNNLIRNRKIVRAFFISSWKLIIDITILLFYFFSFLYILAIRLYGTMAWKMSIDSIDHLFYIYFQSTKTA